MQAVPLPPPTDNLYKFLAISGLLIVLGSIYFPFNLAEDFKKESTKIGMEIAEEQVEVEFLGDEVASLRGIAQKKGKPSEEDKRDVRAYSDALKALKIKSARIKVAHNRNGELLEQIKIIDRITDLSFLFGCALMIFGFKAWYHKVQVHQDRILKKQAEGAV